MILQRIAISSNIIIGIQIIGCGQNLFWVFITTYRYLGLLQFSGVILRLRSQLTIRKWRSRCVISNMRSNDCCSKKTIFCLYYNNSVFLTSKKFECKLESQISSDQSKLKTKSELNILRILDRNSNDWVWRRSIFSDNWNMLFRHEKILTVILRFRSWIFNSNSGKRSVEHSSNI